MKDKLKMVGARMVFLGVCAVILAFLVSGCGGGLGLRPDVYAGYAVFNYPDSYANCAIGSNGVQNNSIQRDLPGALANGETIVKDGEGKETTASSGLFVNAGNFEKSSETDMSAALEILKQVKGSTAGQTQTSSGSTGTSTQNPSNTTTETKSTKVEVPVAVSQASASANTGGSATATPAGTSATEGGATGE